MAMYKRICRECGISFEGGPRAWYCPECRYYRRKELNLKRRKSGGTRRKLGSSDVCERCGAVYIVRSGLQRFCPKCAPINAKETDARLGLVYYNANKDKINPQRREKRREISKLRPKKQCGGKGKVWTLANKDGNIYTTDDLERFISTHIETDEKIVAKVRGRLYEMWRDKRKNPNSDRNYKGWKIIGTQPKSN